MRKTKIVCTIGPACDSKEILTALAKAGMNVARLNFSHGTHEEHLDKINKIKEVRKELNMPIAILLDTKGPEYRIKTFENKSIFLNEGDIFKFTTREVVGNQEIVSVTYSRLHEDLEVGDTILLNNGLLKFEITEIYGQDIITKVLVGGELSNRKSMSFPGKVLKQPFLSEQDKEDLKFGVENGVDFFALSFVSCKQDLLDVKEYLKTLDYECTDNLIAKIENQSGIDNIKEICEECDGIMIGRGDMGVEIPFEELPAVQKRLITSCRLLGKRVITATEMLESMISNTRPTRAEISDVANAIYDGTSAIMLSGETASGKYPVLALETMAKIAEKTEENIHYSKRFDDADFIIKNTADAISHATVGMAFDIKADAIAVCTHSGTTARMVSRFRPAVDVLGLTTNRSTYYKLALSWGVIPILVDVYDSTDVMFYTAKQKLKEVFDLKPGTRAVITGGTSTVSGNTNLIKVEMI
ncbi:MAG: pyruvate kinase [Oscillospiraceae bacterium]|nr:pyruvate kinase [Candidatus Limimonas coprohippi]